MGAVAGTEAAAGQGGVAGDFAGVEAVAGWGGIAGEKAVAVVRVDAGVEVVARHVAVTAHLVVAGFGGVGAVAVVDALVGWRGGVHGAATVADGARAVAGAAQQTAVLGVGAVAGWLAVEAEVVDAWL